MEQVLAENPLVIGVLPGGLSEAEALKILSVAEGEDPYAFEPSEENVFYGDYPVRLPFYLVWNEKTVKVQRLLQYLLSDESARVLRQNQFLPLPKEVREAFILNLDLNS